MFLKNKLPAVYRFPKRSDPIEECLASALCESSTEKPLIAKFAHTHTYIYSLEDLDPWKRLTILTNLTRKSYSFEKKRLEEDVND